MLMGGGVWGLPSSIISPLDSSAPPGQIYGNVSYYVETINIHRLKEKANSIIYSSVGEQ
jgi:hypothetical protein